MDDILRKVFIMDIKKYDPTKPKVMFNDLVNDDIQLNIAKGVIEQYRKAHKHCYETFGKTEAWGLLPDYRRTCIEDIMPDIAERIGRCVAKPRKNKAKNCYHRLLLVKSTKGVNIALTQSKVEQKELLPRNAEFRKGYAKDPQMLMDFMEEDQVPEFNDDEIILYTIIVHMPNLADEKTPEFIDIVFPDKAYKKIEGRIELLNKFPDVVVKEEHEDIPDNTEIPIAPSIEIKKQA